MPLPKTTTPSKAMIIKLRTKLGPAKQGQAKLSAASEAVRAKLRRAQRG